MAEEGKRVSLIILGVVAIVAVIGLVLLAQGSAIGRVVDVEMQGITERASVQVPSPAFCAGVCKTKCPTDSNTFLLYQNGLAAPRCRALTTDTRQRIANCVTLRGKQCPPGI